MTARAPAPRPPRDAAGGRARLAPAALAPLAAGVPALVLSTDRAGRVHATYSWAVALDARRLRLATDHGGRSSRQLRRSGRGAVLVVGTAGLNLLLGGRVQRLPGTLAVPAGPTLDAWELTLTQVCDQSWPGVATSVLRYRWPAPQRAAMRRMERAVIAALRSADARP
jgi:hypothetical protein